MSKPTLCVIVPVYKAAATLDRCVASVLAQQVAGGLHCILVDDGSPDESGGLCDAWAARDPRVTVLHQENRGVSAYHGIEVELAGPKADLLAAIREVGTLMQTAGVKNTQVNEWVYRSLAALDSSDEKAAEQLAESPAIKAELL